MIFKNVFKVETEMEIVERNYQAPQKMIIRPTDSVFSENFTNSLLLRPTFIHWIHSFERPIEEKGKEILDFQIDCIFNESEFHLNLQDHKPFTWDSFNKNHTGNQDWIQLDREKIKDYLEPQKKDSVGDIKHSAECRFSIGTASTRSSDVVDSIHN